MVDQLIDDVSIPSSLLALWTRVALGDPTVATFGRGVLSRQETARKLDMDETTSGRYGMRQAYVAIHMALSGLSSKRRSNLSRLLVPVSRRFPEDIRPGFLGPQSPRGAEEPGGKVGSSGHFGSATFNSFYTDRSEEDDDTESVYTASSDALEYYYDDEASQPDDEMPGGDLGALPRLSSAAEYFKSLRTRMSQALNVGMMSPLWRMGKTGISGVSSKFQGMLNQNTLGGMPTGSSEMRMYSKTSPRFPSTSVGMVSLSPGRMWGAESNLGTFTLAPVRHHDSLLEEIENEFGPIFLKHFRWYVAVEMREFVIDIASVRLDQSADDKVLRFLCQARGAPASPLQVNVRSGFDSFAPYVCRASLHKMCIELGVTGHRETLIDPKGISKLENVPVNPPPDKSRKLIAFATQPTEINNSSADRGPDVRTHAREMSSDFIIGATLASIQVRSGPYNSLYPTAQSVEQSTAFWSHRLADKNHPLCPSPRPHEVEETPEDGDFLTAYLWGGEGVSVMLKESTFRLNQRSLLMFGALMELAGSTGRAWHRYTKNDAVSKTLDN